MEILIPFIPNPICQLIYALAVTDIDKISDSTVDAAQAGALAILQIVLGL